MLKKMEDEANDAAAEKDFKASQKEFDE